MMEREEDLNEELKHIAPDFPARAPMEAPPGYFDQLPDQVLNRWEKEESQQVTKLVIWKRIIGIAAVTAGLFIGIFWYFTQSSPAETKDITSLEAYLYVQENIAEFEFLLETEQINTGQIQVDVEEAEIEEYLIETLEGTDPEDLF